MAQWPLTVGRTGSVPFVGMVGAGGCTSSGCCDEYHPGGGRCFSLGAPIWGNGGRLGGVSGGFDHWTLDSFAPYVVVLSRNDGGIYLGRSGVFMGHFEAEPTFIGVGWHRDRFVWAD